MKAPRVGLRIGPSRALRNSRREEEMSFDGLVIRVAERLGADPCLWLIRAQLLKSWRPSVWKLWLEVSRRYVASVELERSSATDA